MAIVEIENIAGPGLPIHVINIIVYIYVCSQNIVACKTSQDKLQMLGTFQIMINPFNSIVLSSGW